MGPEKENKVNLNRDNFEQGRTVWKQNKQTQLKQQKCDEKYVLDNILQFNNLSDLKQMVKNFQAIRSKIVTGIFAVQSST